MSKQTNATLLMVGALSATVGLVALIALMVVGEYALSAALFLAVLITFLVAIFLLLAFHKKPDQAHTRPVDGGGRGHAVSGAGSANRSDQGAGGVTASSRGSEAQGLAASQAGVFSGSNAYDGGSADPSQQRAAGDASNVIPEAEKSVTENVGNTATSALDSATSAADANIDRVAEAAAETAREAGENVIDTTEATIDVAADGAARASDAVAIGANSARDAVSEAGAGMTKAADSAVDAATRADAQQPASETSQAQQTGTRPQTLEAAREGGADDLKKIKGIGPKLEKLCHSLGFYHFDQVAAWTDDEVAWVDHNLEGFKGRVSRDEWVAQAKLLARGGETAFSKKVDDGSVY